MGYRILTIEDEEHIQRLIEIILIKDGIGVVKAYSGEEALKILAVDKDFHLIIVDIMMPGMDGLNVLAQVKSDLELTKIPIVLLTSLSQENVVMKGIKLGASDFIRKPFHPKELLQRIKAKLPSI